MVNPLSVLSFPHVYNGSVSYFAERIVEKITATDVYKPWHIVTHRLSTTKGLYLFLSPCLRYTFPFDLPLCVINASSFFRSQLRLCFHKEAFLIPQTISEFIALMALILLVFCIITTWGIIPLMSLGLLDCNKLY